MTRPARREDLDALARRVDGLIEDGEGCKRALGEVVERLRVADDLRWIDVYVSNYANVPKHLALWSARRKAAVARRRLSAFQTRLRPFGLEHRARPEVAVGALATLLDVTEDFFADLFVARRIERSRRRTNIAVTRVSVVLSKLRALRAEIGAAGADEPAAAGA